MVAKYLLGLTCSNGTLRLNKVVLLSLTEVLSAEPRLIFSAL